LSSVVLIKQQNLSAIPNFEAAQFTTSDLTEGYGWIDENGMGVWSTAFSGNKTTFQQYANLNASERLYFKIPKETYKPFVSEVFNTTNFNQVPRIVIAYPVLSLKPDTISSMDYRNLDQGINQSLSSTMNIIASITNITSNKSLTEFKDQPVLFNLDSDFLKDNFEFKGIVTASINSAALDNYINNALFTRNIFNNAPDSGSIVSGNDNSHNNTLSSDKPQNLDDSNIIRSPSFFLTPSFTSSSTGETLTEDLKPDILVTDNNGIVLFSSDKRIKVGSSYLSAENFAVIENEYNPTTVRYLETVHQNLTNDKEQSYTGTLELINKQGNRIIVNFEPLLFNGQHVFYLSTNTKFYLSETASNLISTQIVLTFVFVGCLLFMVFSFIAIVLSINKKLKHEVDNKTTQLVQNVRDLEFSNEKLIQSEEMEKEFVNTAAHELRTPTQAITGYTELDDELFDGILKNKNITSDPELETSIKRLYQHHGSISRNASRLDNLIDKLLDVARLESSSNSSKDRLVTLYKEKVDLVKEINEIVNLELERKINDKNIKIVS
jgi:signal transduction histidine kinase